MHEEAQCYRIPGAVWSLELSAAVVSTLISHAQRSLSSKESVGQLYSSDLQSDCIRIDTVTKLKPLSSSSQRVCVDITAVNRERAKFFQNGLHCLGFWHSHPELIPNPSQEDILMAADHALASHKIFAGIVFIIVGTAPPPMGIGVWVHDGLSLRRAVYFNSCPLPVSEGNASS